MAVEDDGAEFAVPSCWHDTELARLVAVADWGIGDPFTGTEAGGWFWLYAGGGWWWRGGVSGFVVDAEGGGAGREGC